MKNHPQDQHDDQLSKALKEWRVENALPPGFQDAVWRKIDRQSHAPLHLSLGERLRLWMTGMVSRPQIAAAYLGLLIVAGASVGWTHGRNERIRVENDLAQRYVRSLDPYLAPRN